MIAERKKEHLEICVKEDVGFLKKTTLLEDIELIHNALPELSLDEIDTSVEFLGKTLSAPIIIASMTGGTPESYRINRELAEVAQLKRIGFAFGSQRPMLEDRELSYTYKVRDVAPDALLLGNIGIVQAINSDTDSIKRLIEEAELDGLFIHLNPAMELIQPEGDRDFKGGYKAIERLLRELDTEIIVKETGCGISREVGRRLKEIGVKHIDVSGAGGTNWIRVEALRVEGERERELISQIMDWGIPTAVSILWLKDLGFETIIATGGITNSLEIAKALVIGGNLCGIARKILKIYYERGKQGVIEFIDDTVEFLKKIMLLVGAGNIAELREVPYIVKGELKDYLEER